MKLDTKDIIRLIMIPLTLTGACLLFSSFSKAEKNKNGGDTKLTPSNAPNQQGDVVVLPIENKNTATKDSAIRGYSLPLKISDVKQFPLEVIVKPNSSLFGGAIKQGQVISVTNAGNGNVSYSGWINGQNKTLTMSYVDFQKNVLSV